MLTVQTFLHPPGGIFTRWKDVLSTPAISADFHRDTCRETLLIFRPKAYCMKWLTHTTSTPLKGPVFRIHTSSKDCSTESTLASSSKFSVEAGSPASTGLADSDAGPAGLGSCPAGPGSGPAAVVFFCSSQCSSLQLLHRKGITLEVPFSRLYL